MPELPEVETVRLGLAPAMEGARFKKVETRRKDLRWPFPKDFIKRLEGQKVEGVGRRAKYLLLGLSNGKTLLSHLGMTGSWRFAEHAIDKPPRSSSIFARTRPSSSGSFTAHPRCGSSRTRAPLAPPRWSERR